MVISAIMTIISTLWETALMAIGPTLVMWVALVSLGDDQTIDRLGILFVGWMFIFGVLI